MNRRKIAAVAMLLLAACKQGNTANDKKETPPTEIVTLTDAQVKNGGITTGPATTKSMSDVLRLTGKIDVPPQNIVSVSVPLGATCCALAYCRVCT